MARPPLSFTLDPKSMASFRASVHEMARRTGKDNADVMRDVMRGVVVKCSGWMPPRRKEQGEEAIDRDLRKIASVKKYDSAREEYARAAELNLLSLLGFRWEQGAIVAARKFTKQEGTAEGAFNYILDANADLLPSHHQRNRRPSDGRVRDNAGQFPGVAIGMQKYIDVLLVSNKGYYKYLRRIQKHVGRLKGGWNAAAQRWKVYVADWVWRHGTKEGVAVDAMQPSGSGYLMMQNNVPYAGRQSGIVKRALKSATKQSLDKLNKSIARNAKRFNKAGR